MSGPATSTSPTLLRSLAGPAADAAWGVFVEKYSPLIEKRCRRAGLQAADRDDTRQQVLSQLVKGLAGFRYDPARRFRGYLSRAVDNAIRTHWRVLARRPRLVGLGGIDVPGPLADLPGELDNLIRDRLHGLSRTIDAVRLDVGPEAWAAFWLTAIDGLSGDEAAARLGGRPSAVYVAKSRVLAKLRAAAGHPPGARGG